MRGPGPKQGIAKKMSTKDMKKNLMKMIGGSKKYFPYIIIASICMAISVVLSIYAPQFLSDFTNEITRGAAKQDIDLNYIEKLGITLAVFYASNAILSYVANYIMTSISQYYAKDLRKAISDKINRMPLKYFDGHQYGDTLSIITNDVDQIGESLQQSVSMLISSVFMLIGVMIAMFITSWQMALAALISLPLMGLMLLLITKGAMPQFKKRQEYIGKVNGIVEENFSAQIIIKSFNAEDRVNSDFEKSNQQLRWTMFKAQFFGGLMQPMMSFISYVAYAAVCLVGGLLMNDGGIVTFGTITAFIVYVNLFQSPLSQIAQAANSLQMAAASSQRVFDFLGEEELAPEVNKTKKLADKDGKEVVKGAVQFKNVSFSYDPSREIIHNFSADIKPGMKVAIVGPTGAGKTTVVNLLMRFYEVNKGDILIDGVSIKDMPRSEVRDIFGMVLQDTWMFEGTIKDNIIYNTKNVQSSQLDEICKEAEIYHYIETLPNGYDYYCEDDSQISGGQKQLITIARAMLKKAPLLILDEATSNVDTRTEEEIQMAMDKLTSGRTSFVIAHRLSTIKNADLILVMKDGNIIEQGNHDSLMKQNGFYASLYNSQFAFE